MHSEGGLPNKYLFKKTGYQYAFHKRIVSGCIANGLKLFIDKSTEVKLISEYIE